MTPIHIGGSDINHLTVCDPATQITSDIAIAYLPLTGGVINGNLAVTGTINNIILDSNSKLTDTTYEPATQQQAGLLSANDKKKLDGIEPGAQVNKLHITINGTILTINEET